MEPQNLSIVLFSEVVRKGMRESKPTLIRHRRQLPLFRHYPDVFVGCEAVNWAKNILQIVNKSTGTDTQISNEPQSLTESQACSLYQKLMDAGLLQNVTNQEEFKNDKSLFRFASDDVDAAKLIRSVAIGYRLYESAQCPNCNLFQKVCALGQLVSCECLRSCDIVTWLVDNAVCTSRDAAVEMCRDMVESDVLKPVDSEVREFTDGRNFYLFAVDYKQPPLTIEQFLGYNMSYLEEKFPPNSDSSPRNKLIHLRQTSDQLVNCSQISTSSTATQQRGNRRKGLSTSSDDSGFSDNGSNISPTQSFQSLLNSDGSMTKAALLHPSAPYVKKSLWVYPDPVGYGFVIRGSGPCFVKIVDPDSPAGKAGLKALQYIVYVNRNDVTGMNHSEIEDLILNGPKFLKITIMQHKDAVPLNSKPPTPPQRVAPPSLPVSPLRQRSYPTVNPTPHLFKKSNSAPYGVLGMPPRRQVVSQ